MKEIQIEIDKEYAEKLDINERALKSIYSLISENTNEKTIIYKQIKQKYNIPDDWKTMSVDVRTNLLSYSIAEKGIDQ